jgi:hypothetical protein
MEGLGWGAALVGRARIGDLAGAAAMLSEHPAATEPPAKTSVLRPGVWSRLAGTAEALVLLGRSEEARRFLPILREGMARGAVLRWTDGGFFQTTVAIVAATDSSAQTIDGEFQAALDLAVLHGHRIEEAEVRRAWGENLLRRGDRNRAVPLLEAAAARYGELNMPRHVEIARSLLTA